MEVIGEAILSALLQPVFEKLLSEELLQFASKNKLDNELKKWESKLQEIHVVLSDAESKQTTSQHVKIWLSKLQDLAYDVEDILDELATEALESKLKKESQDSRSSVRKLLPSTWGIFPKGDALMHNRKTRTILKDITSRLQEIIEEKNGLDLQIIARPRSNFLNNRETAPLVTEPHIYGREKDKKVILDLLSSGETSSSPFSVIPIIAMGGMGKTTLAQLIYNDNSVKFDCKAWVCVSDVFDICKITKTILQQCGGSCGADDLPMLQLQLKEALSGKRFLIVLDDVWNENYEIWTRLRSPLFAGAPGSKFIVTTRSKDVSFLMSSLPAYELRELPGDDCLCLIGQHALDDAKFEGRADLKEVGKEIAKQCKGSPLAAKTLGGLLRGKRNRREWVDILNSMIWELPEEKSDILPALRLSYFYLPSKLKQCFAYCAIFPKDYEFCEGELVLLWMAEGFMEERTTTKQKQMEDVGHKYFQDLVSRSYFQQSTVDKSRYIMHDLISDLAQFVSKEICFNLDDKLRIVESHAKFRHLSFTQHEFDIWERFEEFEVMKNLRTFLPLPISVSDDEFNLSSKVLHELVPKFKCLRVLSLASYELEELPDSMGALKLLRYLDLSFNKISRLPDSFGKLLNLQTLKLRRCSELNRLPESIGNLINLRHLDIRDTFNLQEMPPEIGNLANLRFLSKFVVGQGNGLGIRELMNFAQLHGELHIKGLENVVDMRDAELAYLKDKDGLDVLALEWVYGCHVSRDECKEEQVLNSLEPHHNLKRLSIKFYGGAKFPCWMEDSSFTKLEIIRLEDCHQSKSLPSLGQLQSLKELIIRGLNGVREISEFCGDGFPHLEVLRIEDMRKWGKWCWVDGLNQEVAQYFPKLRELSIIDCPRLVGTLPNGLSSLVKFYIWNCTQLLEIPKNFPSICQLDVRYCGEVVLRNVPHFFSLKILRIAGILGLVSLEGVVVKELVVLEELVIKDCNELRCLWPDGTNLCNSLKRLRMARCKQLMSLVEGEEELLPCRLEDLNISECDNLKRLSNGPCGLTSLRELCIHTCPKLVSFWEGRLPACLKSISISGCGNLGWEGRLPAGLKSISIWECGNLGREGRLPACLKSISISVCGNLGWVGDEMMDEGSGGSNTTSHPFLEELRVDYGGSDVMTIPSCQFPPSLKLLSIENCGIQSLKPSDSLSHLTDLHIEGCRELERFPPSGLPTPNLKRFTIQDCEKLRCLPNDTHKLTSLQSLSIHSCGSLVSFSERGFCFPPNLISLHISHCKSLEQPMSDWGLHRLTSLELFSIAGTSRSTDMRSFPNDDGLLLPTSLSHLSICSFNNLESISRSLQNLTSLTYLTIVDCPKLRLLRKEGIPASLGCLRIIKCPIFEKRRKKKTGDYWPLIAHIPNVRFD